MANDNTYVNNLSYTNKDFASIYRELLEIVPKVTNKWNPQNSNEADPGVVLIKLLSVIGDKLNYNVDKNILESYPISVTQQSNARQLYDTLGYHMHWYQSATTALALKYVGSEISNNQVSSITIPPFTMVTNDEGTLVYTLLGTSGLSGATFSEKNQILAVNAIEGVINEYQVSGSSTITLANLDEDFRLYFSHSQIAQNGIFICNAGQNNFDSWQKVSNLESNSLNKGVYKFGVLPNTTTCYIQFPQDIANLIGDGLNIYYVISQGLAGNISANIINKFYSDVEIAVSDSSSINVTDSFNINNPSATMDGLDPESIQSAFNNYKKVQGTFDTLITCRDYENALYKMSDVVSNSVVSDRTNDINYSNHIITYNGVDNKKILKVKEEVPGTPLMSAFDLGVYALYPMANVYNAINYNRSFTSSALTSVETDDLLSENKSCQQNFINTQNATAESGLAYLFKNFFTLSGKVLTNYKVTETEATDIENNIRLALYKNFNARQVNFGEQPDYDSIVDVIRNADSRIRDVVLSEPSYVLRKLLSNDTIGSFDSSVAVQMNESDSDWVELVARLVVNGTIQLYRFDERFNYDFGQNKKSVIENIHSVSTEVVIPYLDPNDTNPDTLGDCLYDGYLLKANENIQVYAPNLVSTKTFTTYVNYKFSGLSSTILADTIYELKTGERLELSYLDSNNIRQTASNNPNECLYLEGDIISCNFEVSAEFNNIEKTLTASQSIDIKEINQTTLNSDWGKYIYCYWITNSEDANSRDILFNINESVKILDNNEYFIYTDATKTDIVILGSGTKLVRTQNLSNSIVNMSTVTRSQINTEGSSALSPTDWYVWATDSTGGPLQIIENQIYAFGEGTYVKLISTGDNLGVTDIYSTTITNIEVAESTFKSQQSASGKYKFINTSGVWKLNGVTVSLINYGIVLKDSYGSSVSGSDNDNFTIEIGVINNKSTSVSTVQYGVSRSSLQNISTIDLTSYSWEARSRLNLNASSNYSQQLSATQTLSVTYPLSGTDHTFTFTGWAQDCILFNENLFLVGGPNLDVAVTNYAGETNYTLAAYSYLSHPVISKIDRTGIYYRIPSKNLEYGQGTKYNAPTQINIGNNYRVTSNTNILTLDNVALPIDTVFDTNLNLLSGGDQFIVGPSEKVTIKNAVLPFTFNKASKYIIPVYKTGSDYTFDIGSDINNVVFKPIVGATTTNQLTNPGMYYLTADFSQADAAIDSCSRMIITSTLVEGGDNSIVDYLDVYKPVVLTDETFWGLQLADANMLGEIEKAICGHLIFGTSSIATSDSFIDTNTQFNYTYKVPASDLIDTDSIADANAFWDPNNIFNKYTIAQINTKNSLIQVSSSSKTSR